MIKAGIISALTGLGALAVLTPAYAAGFAELDANADGQLDAAELEASFGVHAEATLEAYDSDGDQMISVAEAEAMAASSAAASAEGAATAADSAATAAETATTEATEGLATAGSAVTGAAETGLSTATEATEGAAEAVGNVLPTAEADVEAGASVEAGTEVSN
ncbi:hypothetical protein C9E81_18810 [Paracoccus alkanivorans]|uniref:EF-hand domain-containing protein n=2 Tax=Paracoccus alkanivorans TaxID=2116655 RepID=A0A3M0M7K8_9RHOB|nr:hypothetical protein C9E81_18810 [Paracoccus alkanivorans]